MEKKIELLWFLDHRLLDVPCGSESSLQRFKKSKQLQQSCDYEEVEQSLAEDMQNVLSVGKMKLEDLRSNEKLKTYILLTTRAVGNVDSGSLQQYWRPPTTQSFMY